MNVTFESSITSILIFRIIVLYPDVTVAQVLPNWARSLLVILEFPSSQLSADVLGCNRMGQTGEVLVVDTWNPDNLPRTNVLDANQVRTRI